jgi:MerR family Zn(II)-responsive transcriptional regulator of zntA
MGAAGRSSIMFTIGKLASLSGVSHDALRYYEREGLLTPASKSPAGFRLFDEDSARRIRFIKHAQECGFTLAEIRELLVVRTRDKACCGEVRTRAIEKKLQIENKIRAMRAMSKALDQLIADCADEAQPVKECTIIAALERANLSARGR